MTAALTLAADGVTEHAAPGRPAGRRRATASWPQFAATLFALLNAAAFCVIRPGVPDLWAARARASAASHGAGLTYWFSWFGGSTPGDYSVLTPYACGLFGTAVVLAVATVVTTGLVTVLVRDTPRAVAASWVASLAAVINLWCGRVPFLVGAAFGVGALLCVRHRRTVPSVVLAVLSVLASPVSGVFVGLGLSGVLLSPRTRAYRPTVVLTLAFVAGTLVALAGVFGVPGPEPLPLYLVGEIALALTLMLFAVPSGHLRYTLLACAATATVLFVVPNGLGANLARLVLFGLPPAAVALSRRRTGTLAVLVLPILVLGSLSSVSAVRSATQPGSSAAYYAPLAAELDSLPSDHRLELVGAGHAAYGALLEHAVFARGWETQQDQALDAVLYRPTLDAGGYRAWLDDNAVGYVALDVGAGSSPEVRVVRTLRPDYLRIIWSSPRWRLYQVAGARPIVAAPAVLDTSTQGSMTVRVPCACRTSVRVRWSSFLDVAPQLPAGTPDAVEDSIHPRLTHDRSGWTTLTTDQPGIYVLS